jgi:hypothetical protein
MLFMEGSTVHLPQDLADKVQAYCEEKGLEKFSIATRRLIRLGLEVEAKKVG